MCLHGAAAFFGFKDPNKVKSFLFFNVHDIIQTRLTPQLIPHRNKPEGIKTASPTQQKQAHHTVGLFFNLLFFALDIRHCPFQATVEQAPVPFLTAKFLFSWHQKCFYQT